MIKKEELADLLIVRLNELLEVDRCSVWKLLDYHVDCNSAMRDHKSVQVTPDGQVGVLGILNGLVGKIEDGPREGWGLITIVVSDVTGEPIRFERTREIDLPL